MARLNQTPYVLFHVRWRRGSLRNHPTPRNPGRIWLLSLTIPSSKNRRVLITRTWTHPQCTNRSNCGRKRRNAHHHALELIRTTRRWWSLSRTEVVTAKEFSCSSQSRSLKRVETCNSVSATILQCSKRMYGGMETIRVPNSRLSVGNRTRLAKIAKYKGLTLDRKLIWNINFTGMKWGPERFSSIRSFPGIANRFWRKSWFCTKQFCYPSSQAV